MTTKREKILQKLNPKFLKITPKLSGNEGSFIDLDTDDSLVSGAKELMRRFLRNQDLCEKNKRLSAQKETELTISTAKYNEKDEICDLITESLTLPFKNNEDDVDCEKPGRRLQKLKMELQEKMSAKWEEEYKKRVNENRIYSESIHKSKKKYIKDDYDLGDDEIDGDEDDLKENSSQEKTTCSKDEYEEDVAVESEDENLDDGDEADNEFDDEEENLDVVNNENKASNYDGDNLEKDDDYENCSLIPAYQPGGGMLYGGSELTQADDELPQNLLSPSLRFSVNELSGSKTTEFRSTTPNSLEPTPKKAEPSQTEILFTTKTKLFSQNPNDSYDLNEAFDLCSGKFPDAEDKTVKMESQNLVRGNEDDNKDVDDDDNDCVDNIENSLDESKAEDALKNRKFQNIIVFDDSEEEHEEVVTKQPEEPIESQSAPLKILSDDEDELIEKQKPKKIRKNLRFSDDEEEEEKEEEENEISDAELEEDGDDERSVHYDSEENEINPKEFFEKEAELSGSEWSGDEDERGLDEFDVEEGDADNLDQDQVRSQLEKIHIRRVLDDDAREVRLIQEILFEDGDLHSDGKRRDRKFKWKNLGAFEEDGEGGAKDENGNDSEDDGAEEEELRKLRLEKELFLMAKKKNGDLSSDEEIVGDFNSVKVTRIKTCVKATANGENNPANSKSVTTITEIANATSVSTIWEPKTGSSNGKIYAESNGHRPSNPSAGKCRPQSVNNVWHSKMKYDTKTVGNYNTRGSFLRRNEEFLSRLAKVTSGVTDNVLGPKNSKNFVFTTKSPEKGDSERNVVSKRQMEDSETCGRREKKLKLLPPEITTGPSIVDLLV